MLFTLHVLLVVLGKHRLQPGQAAAQSGRVLYHQGEAGEAYP